MKFKLVKVMSGDVCWQRSLMPQHDKAKLSKEGHEKAKSWDTPDVPPAVAVASSMILL